MRWRIAVVGLSLAVVVIDQLLKITSDLTVLNQGASFGFLSSSNTAPLLHISAIVVVLVYFYDRTTGIIRDLVYASVFISLSNLFDRLHYGHVRDYWEVLGIWFNLADLAIVSIFVMIILISLVENLWLKRK